MPNLVSLPIQNTTGMTCERKHFSMKRMKPSWASWSQWAVVCRPSVCVYNLYLVAEAVSVDHRSYSVDYHRSCVCRPYQLPCCTIVFGKLLISGHSSQSHLQYCISADWCGSEIPNHCSLRARLTSPDLAKSRSCEISNEYCGMAPTFERRLRSVTAEPPL